MGNKATERSLDSVGLAVVGLSGVNLVMVFYWLVTDVAEAIRKAVAERASSPPRVCGAA